MATPCRVTPLTRKPVLWIGLVGTLVLGAAASAWFLSQPPSDLQRASHFYHAGAWADAASLARQHLRSHPRDSEAVRILARALFRLGRDDSARPLYENIGMDAMEAEDFARLGDWLSRQGAMASAITAYERGLQKDPRHTETLAELAPLYAAADRLSESVDLAKRLATHDGWNARAQALLGALHWQIDQPTAAAGAWSQALRADSSLAGMPTSPQNVRKLLAEAQLASAQANAAKSTLAPLLADADRQTLWLLSRAHLQLGEIPQAIAQSELANAIFAGQSEPREPAVYVGSAKCRDCHPAQFRAHHASHHATTFSPPWRLANFPVPDRPITDPIAPEFRHAISREGDTLTFTTSNGNESESARIHFAFGSNDRGATLVGRDSDKTWREMRLSLYGDDQLWDITTGHEPHPSPGTTRPVSPYLGRVLSPDAVRGCISCHATNLRAAESRDFPTASDLGIGCEQCHGPAGNHLLAVAAKPAFRDLAIAQKTTATGAQVTALCAGCHSPRGLEVQRDDPTAIRFQGTTLTWSRCFTESAGALSCVSCHNPHADVRAEPAYYDAKCLSCHTQSNSQVPAVDDGTRPIQPTRDIPHATCPINTTSDCTSCHMPTREGVIPHTKFADHWIRVHRDDKEQR